MSKSPLHASLLRRLFRLAQAAVAGTGRTVLKEDPIMLVDSESEPDISVIDGDEADYGLGHPKTACLVMEVAVTTVELDRANAAIYAEANILEYWPVLVKDEAVEVFTEPRGGRYTQRRLYIGADVVVATMLPALRVELEALFRD